MKKLVLMPISIVALLIGVPFVLLAIFLGVLCEDDGWRRIKEEFRK